MEKPSHQNNVVNVPAPENDRRKLLIIFPEEIWGPILGNVDNTNDFYRIRNASQLFQDILSEHLIRILFPSVFKVLVKQCAIQHWEKLAGATEDNDNEDFEKWIGFTDLLPLRQVCRSWKKGMDDFLQNTVFEYEFPNECMSIDGQIYDEIDTHYTEAFEFTSADGFTRFRDKFDATHLENGKVNPFPTRRVGISPPIIYDDDDELDRFYHQLVCFLQDYGIHIWYFLIDGNETDFAGGLIQIHNNLGLLLEQVPNLKILWIRMLDNALSADEEKQLVERYQQTVFTALKNLEYIDQFAMPVLCFTEIMKTPFPKLQRLAISVATKNDLVAFLENSYQIPIKKLDLNVSCGQGSWEDLFNATTRQYGETLEQLYAAFSSSPTVDYALTGRVTFHKLRVLYLELYPFPLDFLLGLVETLEKLELKFGDAKNWEFETAEKRERVVKFNGYLNEMYRSNIWIVFPKLQSLDVRMFSEDYKKLLWSCTRKDWQRKNVQIGEHV